MISTANLRILRWLFACLIAAGVCAPARAQNESTTNTSTERTSETIVAQAAWGDIKLEEIADYYAFYLYPSRTVPFAPVVDPSDAASMPAEWIDKLARSYVIARASELRVDEDPDQAFRDHYQKTLNTWLLNYALPEARDTFIAVKVEEPTEEAIAKYYQQHQPRFFHPFEFSMRHIFLMTYEPYVLQKNETLEGVAQRMLGDKRRVAEILSDVAGRPRRWVAPEEREKKFFKPESEGERLLIPMTPEKIEQVRQKMEMIRGRAVQGESFEALAKEFSEAEVKGSVIGPLPSGVSPERWMQRPLLEAAAKLPKDGISEVIPTRHGYHLIQIVDKKEERIQTLDEVRAEIRTALKKRAETGVQEEALKELMRRPELVIDMDMLAKAPDIADDAVVATVGLHRFIWKDIMPIWQKEIGPGATRDQVAEGLRFHGGIMNALTLAWADEAGIWNRPDLAKKHKFLRTGVYGATLNKSEMDLALKEVLTEEAVQKYYEEHKDKDYRVSLTGTYQVLVRNVTPGKEGDAAELERVRAALDAELGGVRNINEFLGLAKRTNPPAEEGKPWRVMTPAQLENITGPTGDRLRVLPSGKWTSAYIEGNTVRAVAMIERMDARYRALVEVRAEIQKILQSRFEGEIRGRLEQHWIEASKYKFVLNEPPSRNAASATP